MECQTTKFCVGCRPARWIIGVNRWPTSSPTAKDNRAPRRKHPFGSPRRMVSCKRSDEVFMANAELSGHAELSPMLRNGSRPSVRKKVSPPLTPQWRSLTIGNKLTSRKKKRETKQKKQRRTTKTRFGKAYSAFDSLSRNSAVKSAPPEWSTARFPPASPPRSPTLRSPVEPRSTHITFLSGRAAPPAAALATIMEDEQSSQG